MVLVVEAIAEVVVVVVILAVAPALSALPDFGDGGVEAAMMLMLG